jgi:polyisoprenoid-binding protein YceI
MTAYTTGRQSGPGLPPTPTQGVWQVDASASQARFRVRNFGLLRVLGTFRVTGGVVHVGADGRPHRIEGAVDVSTVATGNRRRDADLCGHRFLDVEHCPELALVAAPIEDAVDGWTATASVVVRGRPAPVTLRIRPVAPADDGWRVEATGVLDLRTTPIRAPRALVGRYVEVTIDAVLVPPRPVPAA